MGDKDTKMISGNPVIFIGKSDVEMQPLKAVENSIELDSSSAHKKIPVEPLRVKPVSIEFSMPIRDAYPIIGFDEALESHDCSLIIEVKPTINKPKNLKYPNKKRARRVWKKWAKRYGTSPGKTICLPNVEVESSAGCVSVNVYQRKNGNN